MTATTADTPLAWPSRLLLAVFGVTLALAFGEAALRVARFQFDLVPTLEFGWPDPVAIRDVYRPDADLVWVTRDYRATLAEARRTGPAVVFMGDSCTEFGDYPSRTIAALQAAADAADRVAAQLHAGEIPLIGRTEAAVSADISQRLIAEGHDVVNFAIVAAGGNAASPHHHAGDRVIAEGDRPASVPKNPARAGTKSLLDSPCR